jgi:flagellar assembly factor FliW
MTSTTHLVIGSRFGNIEFAEEDVIRFPKGLIGLNDLHEFVVVCLDEKSPFRWLQSCQEPSFALLVTDPKSYIRDYEPIYGSRTLGEISLFEESPKLVFVTVTIPPGRPQDMTLNLRGPIVINAENRIAAQCVLDDETYTTKHRVFSQSDEISTVAA